MKLTGTLIRLGSLVCGPIATIVMIATGTVKCGGGEPIDFTSSTTGDEGGSGGTGGVGGSGGEETSGTGATGGGGDATGGSGVGGTGGAGGSTVSSGGAGGTTTSTGGGLPVGCEPPSPYGYNCAQAACGMIENYTDIEPGSNVHCDKTCMGESALIGVNDLPSEISWVFDTFTQGSQCAGNGCAWSFVVRVSGKGCVRATGSDGVHVASQYSPTVCGSPSEAPCLVSDVYAVAPSDQIRIVATVDAGAIPEAAWLRIETTPETCAAAAWGCN